MNLADAQAGGGEADVCFICLDGAGGAQGASHLVRVCACPRPVHVECLARWQLQQAGKSEERFCRFCSQQYPDWKHALTPVELRPSTPIMAVSVRGRVHKLRVKPGPEGKEDFKRQVRALLGYDDDMEFDVIFECKTPHNGEKLQLHGFSAFDAATHCAAVSAAKRLKNKQHRHMSDGSSSGSSAAGGSSTGGSSIGSGSGSSSIGSGSASSGSSGVLPAPEALQAGPPTAGSSSSDEARLAQPSQAAPPRQQQLAQADPGSACLLGAGNSWGSGALATVAEAPADAADGQQQTPMLPPAAPAAVRSPPAAAAASGSGRPSRSRSRSSHIPAAHARSHAALQRQTEAYLAQQPAVAAAAGTAGSQLHLHLQQQQQQPRLSAAGSSSAGALLPGPGWPSPRPRPAQGQAGTGLSDALLPAAASSPSSSTANRAALLVLGEATGEWSMAAPPATGRSASRSTPEPAPREAGEPPAAAACPSTAAWEAAEDSGPSQRAFATAALQACVAVTAAGGAPAPLLVAGDSCSAPVARLGSGGSGGSSRSSLGGPDAEAAAGALLHCNALSEPLPACPGLQPSGDAFRCSASSVAVLPAGQLRQQLRRLGLGKPAAGLPRLPSVKKQRARLVAWLKRVLPLPTTAKQLPATYTLE